MNPTQQTKISAAVTKLNDISGSDPERAHDAADRVLLELVHPTVRAAYERLARRAKWWAAS